MDNYSKPIKNITIVGAGFMGTQIGFHCAVKGYKVCFYDASSKALDRGNAFLRGEIRLRLRSPARKCG